MIILRQPKPLLLCVAIFSLVLGLILSPSATAGKPKEPPPVDGRILVTAVDVNAQQLTITFQRTKKVQVYTVDSFTAVTVENLPGTLKDIKVGDQLFSYVERDGHTLDSLTVGKADPVPTAEK